MANPSSVPLDLPLHFANTARFHALEERSETLRDPADLFSWCEEAGLMTKSERARALRRVSVQPEEGARLVADAVALRDLLQAVFSRLARQRPLPADALERLQTLYQSAISHTRLATEKGGVVMVWEKAASEDLLVHVLARSAVELLLSDEIRRLRECMGRDCSRLFLDRSKNGSRRWCDMSACGNRAKVRRFYRRSRGAALES